MKEKNQIQREDKNWNIEVSSSNHLIFDNKNFQNDKFVNTITIGKNIYQIIIKKRERPRVQGFQFSVKNKIDKKKTWSKKSKNIDIGLNVTSSFSKYKLYHL